MLFWGPLKLIKKTSLLKPDLFLKYAFFESRIAVGRLKVGDVLISKSGNHRIIISTKNTKAGRKIKFLTWFINGNIRIQSALENKIDHSKVYGVVRRLDYDLLAKYTDNIEEIVQNWVVLKNLEVLLGKAELGKRLVRITYTGETQDGNYVPASLVINSCGEITAVEPKVENEINGHFEILTLRESNPDKEYIKQLRVYPVVPAHYKELFIFTTILANSIKNAKNFITALE